MTPSDPTDLIRERWQPIPGYGGLYEASDQGRVRSIPRTVVKSNGQRSVVRGGILGGKIDHGYRCVTLCKDRQKKNYRVHRLVLMAFVGMPLDGQVACHWDDDRLNNRLSNLRWGTAFDNMADMARNHGGGRVGWTPPTHCRNGHEFTDENTAFNLNPDGSVRQRRCRVCSREKDARYRAKKIAERQAAA